MRRNGQACLANRQQICEARPCSAQPLAERRHLADFGSSLGHLSIGVVSARMRLVVVEIEAGLGQFANADSGGEESSRTG